MHSLLTLTITGFGIGFSTALSPGPLLALIISETLKYGLRTGAMLALTPVLTDAPLIIIAIFITKAWIIPPLFLGSISLLGAAMLCKIGWHNLHVIKEDIQQITPAPKKSLMQAVTVNFLNPYPYLFWFSIATPMLAKTDAIGTAVLSTALLVGVTAAMYLVVFCVYAMRQRFLRYMPLFARIFGVILMIFAVLLFVQGITFLKQG